MCFWFEGSFVHKYLFDFRKLQFVTKEMFSFSFPNTSRFSFFLLFLPASKWFRKMPLPNDCCAILTKVIGPRTSMELTSEQAAHFLFKPLGFDCKTLRALLLSLEIVLSGVYFYIALPVCFQSSVTLFASILEEIFYSILFPRSFDSFSPSCLPAD